MEIYILRDEGQIGPFSKDAAQILIEQGTVSADDLAWCRGTFAWLPLGEVLNATEPAAESPTEPAEQAAEPTDIPEPEAAPPPAAASPPASTEPASATQIAFLSYFGVAIPVGLLKDDAEALIASESQEPRNAKRLASWEVDRLRLHPDLFAKVVEEKTGDRVQFFHDLCQTAGADLFTGVTKAHCQVLVAFLDVTYPRWDASQALAIERYFFPAIAEKFPQLVNRAWRGRLHYADAPHAAARATAKSPTTKLTARHASPLAAIARGVVLGLLILAALYAAHLFMRTHKGQSPTAEKASTSAML